MQVQICYESERGCGFRKPGKDGVGIYLRGGSYFEECERLPYLLDVCPCCGAGIKASRGFTWINPMVIFDPYTDPVCTGTLEEDPYHKHLHERCWMCNPELLGSKAGLIWIGEKHYATARDFSREAATMGISRKIAAIPIGFEVGVHAIFLAHRKAIIDNINSDGTVTYKPGVFMAFKPTHIDIVIDDPDDVPDKAIEIAKRVGEDKCKIIKVIPDKEGEEETEDTWGMWEE